MCVLVIRVYLREKTLCVSYRTHLTSMEKDYRTRTRTRRCNASGLVVQRIYHHLKVILIGYLLRHVWVRHNYNYCPTVTGEGHAGHVPITAWKRLYRLSIR